MVAYDGAATRHVSIDFFWKTRVNILLRCFGTRFSTCFVASAGESSGTDTRGLLPEIKPRWYMTKPINPTITKRTTTAPTTIPAIAPLDNPEEEG